MHPISVIGHYQLLFIKFYIYIYNLFTDTNRFKTQILADNWYGTHLLCIPNLSLFSLILTISSVI